MRNELVWVYVLCHKNWFIYMTLYLRMRKHILSIDLQNYWFWMFCTSWLPCSDCTNNSHPHCGRCNESIYLNFIFYGAISHSRTFAATFVNISRKLNMHIHAEHSHVKRNLSLYDPHEWIKFKQTIFIAVWVLYSLKVNNF